MSVKGVVCKFSLPGVGGGDNKSSSQCSVLQTRGYTRPLSHDMFSGWIEGYNDPLLECNKRDGAAFLN